MVEKKLRKYLVPNMFAMIGISCYVLADTFFISAASGTNGITALNLALPVYGIMFAIGSMIGIGSATQYSLAKSLGKKDADRYFSNSIFWALLCSIIFVILGIVTPDGVLKLMGADKTILDVGKSYMRTVLCFAPAFILNYTFTAFVRNDNSPNLAMAATLSSSAFNILFDYIFMFPMNMGMFGAALATGLSPIVSICVCAVHFFSKKNTIKFQLKMPDIKKLFYSCSLGVSSFVGEISSAVTSLAFNFILLDLIGNVAVAAYGVVANVSLVGIAIFNGVSQGLQPMASNAEGTSDEDAKKRIIRFSLKMAMAAAGILIVLSVVFAENIVQVFNSENSAEMADYAVTGLQLYSLGFLPAAVNIVKSGFFSAIGKAKECTIISVSRGIVAIVFFAFVLSRICGIYGVWLAFLVSEVFTFGVGLLLNKKKG